MRYRKPKRPSRMDSPETLERLAQDTEGRQTM